MALYLTLGVFALLVVGFISQKFPLGAVALTCVTILYLSGVLTFEEAYGNFANDNVILVGAMFILSAAIAKTPIVEKINLAIVKLLVAPVVAWCSSSCSPRRSSCSSSCPPHASRCFCPSASSWTPTAPARAPRASTP